MGTLSIEASKVYKRFGSGDDEILALGPLDLEIPQGQFVSILGPSGCGKSTLLAILAGLDQPSEGSVLIAGDQLAGANSDAGIVFQSDFLLEWRTVLRNVLLQLEMRGQKWRPHVARAQELLASVGLSDAADLRPSQLSGGMRQRAAICRALVHDPPMLLMDEPFGALDAITREQLNIDLSKIVADSGKTAVFVTHSIEEAVFMGDRVLVMSERPGRIIADVMIDVPRPRGTWPRGASVFDSYEHEVREALERGGAYQHVDH